jgi:hypothetical protein
MLIWFMHGASVRNIQYPDPMRYRLIEAFTDRGLAIPEFYTCYWGDIMGNSNLWDFVQQDLEHLKWEQPQFDLEDMFHYRLRREQLISGFFNDIFNYLNPKQGKEVRRTIARQLLDALSSDPFEEELHIVAHSLSCVILWDMMFSDRYDESDPAFYFRSVINGLTAKPDGRKVTLRSLTTMGSPLLFLNRVLDIDLQRLKDFTNHYSARDPLRWVNIINASDIFAYPMRASLDLMDEALFFQDHYLGESNFIKKNIGDVTMALGMAADHTQYWRSSRTARVVAANVMKDLDRLSACGSVMEFGTVD